MGMFDTILFHGDTAPRCAAGHRLADLQTKDLECGMEVYSVFDAQLYRPGKKSAESIEVDERGRLTLTETRTADPASISGAIVAYGYCAECSPVLYLCDSALHRDYVQERRPWCEWRFVFRDGRLERCETVRLESREAVADALRREGLEVLDDNERLARLHLERRSSRGWSEW